MALTIKNAAVEKLAEEVAALSGETKTQTIKEALEERRQRLSFRIAPARRRERLVRFLEEEIWAGIPADQLGRPHDTALDDQLLGYGPDGV